MKKNVLLSFILCICCPFSAIGASSPMVERHIFSPEPDRKNTHKSTTALKLEKELLFTGVIISSQGRWAMIREKGENRDTAGRALRKVGDEIKGMVIKEIGSNFLILVGQGKEVRLNLYHEGKLRPSMPVASESLPLSDEKISGKPSSATQKSGTSATRTESVNPFAQASKAPAQGAKQKRSAPPPVKNPFPQEGLSNPFPVTQDDQNPFPDQNTNAFPQEMPPNPFLQEQPPNPFLKQSQNPASK